MIFDVVMLTERETQWLRDEPFVPWTDMLHFPMEVQGILTLFRERVLNYIYRTALGLADGRLESATVEAISEPDEDDSLHLNLAMTIKMDWDVLDQLHDQVLERLAAWSEEWSLDEQEEYGRWIFFSLTPSHI